MTASRRALPPLNALRSFEVAGRRLNFRAAADDLGVTQGAVAQQVRALEDHLGFALFDRLPRGLALTPLGASYLAHLTQAFDLIGEATDEARQNGTPSHRTVTLSVTPTFGIKVLVPRLARFQKANPSISVQTVATAALSDLDRDQVDIAVRLTRAPVSDRHEALPLFAEDLIAVARPDLVANRPLPLSDADLRDLPLVHDAHQHWQSFLGSSAPVSGAMFDHTALAIDAAIAGHGVALSCRAFIAEDLAAGRLVQVSDKALSTGLSYVLVRKRRDRQGAAADAVWRWCAANLTLAVLTSP